MNASQEDLQGICFSYGETEFQRGAGPVTFASAKTRS